MARGGRISLTAFEADWLLTVISTTHDIAIDSLPFIHTAQSAQATAEPWDAWERIVDKVREVGPDLTALSQEG